MPRWRSFGGASRKPGNNAFRTSSQIHAPPVTFAVEGKQYVTLCSGNEGATICQALIEHPQSIGKPLAGLGRDLGNRGQTEWRVRGVNDAPHGAEHAELRDTLELAHSRALQRV